MKPTLVVMAAGMGSRFGGLKQVEPMGPNGEFIIDYSIFDAARAGFGKVVFVIKKELSDVFHETVGVRAAKYLDVDYAYQSLDDLPDGYTIPEGRVKPWGTAHAVYSARNAVDTPFAVINADDFYGRGAYDALAGFLRDAKPHHYALAGYVLENTLTENGSVARGICVTDENKNLVSVTERTCIKSFPDASKYSEDGGESWTAIPARSIVSLNTWGFTPDFFDELGRLFPAFLDNALKTNPLKGEYFLPSVVSTLIGEKKATVRVLENDERWYGVTYREDAPRVREAIRALCDSGRYEGMKK